MAAAYSARKLGVPATIVVPSVTPAQTVQSLKDEGADVIIHGKVSDILAAENISISKHQNELHVHLLMYGHRCFNLNSF